jgi:hypothetical protein
VSKLEAAAVAAGEDHHMCQRDKADEAVHHHIPAESNYASGVYYRVHWHGGMAATVANTVSS